MSAGPLESWARGIRNSPGDTTEVGSATVDTLPGFPFTFSSTQRDVGSLLNRYYQLTADQGRDNPAKSTRTPEEIGQEAVAAAKRSLTTIEGSVTLLINPKSVSFDQPKRIAKQDTMRGSVIHHFTNSLEYNNDILELNFQGNTGIIVPLPLQPGVDEETYRNHVVRCKSRLSAWHSLYALTREPMYWDQKGDGKMVRNKFSVTFASPLIPVPVVFIGFFREVLSFTESGEKPRSRDYSMGFTVERTIPDLNKLGENVIQSFNKLTLLSPSRSAREVLTLSQEQTFATF
jgi:hypothetical protein